MSVKKSVYRRHKFTVIALLIPQNINDILTHNNHGINREY